MLDTCNITDTDEKNIGFVTHRPSCRKKLLRWLYEVVNEFKYSQVTFSTVVFVLDRYMKDKKTALEEYQLTGISALFLCAKTEERACKCVNDYANVTDGLCTEKEILKKEIDIFEFFDFNLMFKLPHTFLKSQYLEVSCKHTTQYRQELFLCAFSYAMEKDTYKGDMYLTYLEGIKEARKFLSGRKVDSNFKFYLENTTKLNPSYKIQNCCTVSTVDIHPL